jgi:hypothetical protein
VESVGDDKTQATLPPPVREMVEEAKEKDPVAALSEIKGALVTARLVKVRLVMETSPGVERRNAECDKENVVFDAGVKSTVERESEPAVTKRRVNSTLSSIQVNAQFVRVREEEDEMR